MCFALDLLPFKLKFKTKLQIPDQCTCMQKTKESARVRARATTQQIETRLFVHSEPTFCVYILLANKMEFKRSRLEIVYTYTTHSHNT